MERKQQEALQMQQQNGQIQQQSAMAAEQAKQQTAQMQAQIDIQILQAKTEFEAKLIELRGQFDLERERIAATGRVESSFVQAKERDTANIRDNKTKLMQADKMEDMGEIDVPAELESRVAPETAGGEQLDLSQLGEIDLSSEPTPEEQQMAQQEMMGQQMGGQEQMMQEQPEEQMAEENPQDARRRMMEQYLQQVQE